MNEWMVCETQTSFKVSTAFSIPLRLGGVIAQRNTDLGSPISNLLVCNTSDSSGQRYRRRDREREIIVREVYY